MNTNEMIDLSEAIAADVATLGCNARPEGWAWVEFDEVYAWVHPEWVSRIAGVAVVDVVALMSNLLWAAKELDAGRVLTVEASNYLHDAQGWLNAQKKVGKV
jgi:hypothetical protein